MIEEIDETDDADLAQADEMDDADLAQALALSMLKPSRQASDKYRLPSVSDLPEATLTILLKVLSNVIEKPDELKYRSLNKTNKNLSQKLFPHQDAVAFLYACGFEESKEGVQLPEGADLKLVDEALNSVRAALEPAEKPTTTPPPPPAAKSPTTPRPPHPLGGACGTPAVDQIMEAVKGAGAFSAGGSVSDLAPPAAELAVWRRQQSLGIVGFIFEDETPHALLELGTRVLDIGAVVDGGAKGTVVGWKTAQGRFYDTSGGMSSDGCVRVYYDQKPSDHESNPWNVVAANRLLFLDAAAPDPPYDTLTRWRPPQAMREHGSGTGVGTGGGRSAPSKRDSAPSKRETTQKEHLRIQKSKMLQMLQMARASASIDRVPDNPEHASIWPHGAPHPDLRIGVRVRDSRSGVCGYVLGWVHHGVHYGDVSGGLEEAHDGGARVCFDRPSQDIRQKEWNLDARRLEFVTGDLSLNIFMAAAESVTRLEALLNSPGCNPDVRDASGASPLWHACRAGSLECTRLLLERRADVQIQPRGKLSPLGVAAQFGFVVCVQLLLEYRANMEAMDDEQFTPLYAAVRGAHSSCVEALVNARANLECKTKPLECTPLGWLCCVEPNLNLPILEMLLQGRANVDTHQFSSITRSLSPLAFAVLGDRTDAVKWLLANGANVHLTDADGDPPTLLACISDHPECCRLLLGAKADANATRKSGTTLLNAAVHGDSIECVQLLLEHGAAQTINKKDQIGTHPMHWACQDAYPKILELLCKAKADVENKNGKGGSPLMLAFGYDDESQKEDKLECLRILIEHKVDVNAIDPRDGESAICSVSKKGWVEAAALLLKAGATATIGHMDNDGAHPMHWAAQDANPPLLKLLIEAKGNVEQRNGKGGTPLMLATCATSPRKVECLRMLLKAKADPNQLDHDNDPAIIRAMMRDDEAQCAALLEAGARANATDGHGIRLVQRFGALAQPKMLRLLIQHGADVSGVLDLCETAFSDQRLSGMLKKPVQVQNEVLQLLRDAPLVRARFLEEQRVKEQAERSQQEAEARRKAQEVEAEARRKAQEEEERRQRQEQAAAERRRADDRKVLVAWLRDTCRLPEDELVSVADIFLEVKFRTVSQIEALQGRNREDWPGELSKGHRVSIDDAVLRTRQPPTPPAPPHGAGVRPDPPPLPTISPGTQYDASAKPKVQRQATSSSSSSIPMLSSQPSRVSSEASTASSSGREMVEVLAQRCHEPDADVEDVVAFFEAIKLPQYVPMLREREVDGRILLDLAEQGMESLRELVPNNLDATKHFAPEKSSDEAPRGSRCSPSTKKTLQRVAIKRVEVDDDSQANRVFGEYTRMLQMRHELLVKGHSIFIEELDLGRRQVNMVMEYCEGGDLAGFLARQMRSGTPPSEDDVTGKLTMVRTPLESIHDAL
ncbi:ankyrin repeat protein [Chrysochromulina tobinii]|uniref:Ankyrin repeat protein n=1 Tax=Chrysochromulina tobinii TaxID=1460289 RepID=A0A0M0JGL1_9EUKA|nr:ankyrin repeat protein [Chrysochromulina tobinii]|eukprot:KOO25462.1 ankyrin repeat protein [Chrysochromulina sp. CCMP291]